MPIPQPHNIKYGSVVGTTPLTVAFNGTENAAAVPVSRLSSYTAVASDVVILLRVGPAWVILGKVV